MVIYEITFLPLEEDLHAVYLVLLTPFYVDNVAFDGSEHSSANLLKILMERGLYQGHFLNRDKLLFIADMPDQEEAAKSEFVVESLDFNF